MSGLGALFSPPKPQVQATVRMPDQQDPAALEAARKKRADLMAGSGRASTDLTGNGGAYSNTLLGA